MRDPGNGVRAALGSPDSAVDTALGELERGFRTAARSPTGYRQRISSCSTSSAASGVDAQLARIRRASADGDCGSAV